MVKTFNRLITQVNRTKRTNRKIEWVALHYVGAESTAANNAKYFSTRYIGASAHYFVDETSIWQSVEEKDDAWSVGLKQKDIDSGKAKYYNAVRNSNSINIEMCCKKKNGKWFIEPETIENTLWLVKDILKRYNLPISRVQTHYQTTHKLCPEPWVRNPNEYQNFLERLEKEMADIPEVSIVDKEQRIKDVMNVDGNTIFWFECYKYGIPYLIDKAYKVCTDAAKWRKYLENGGKDIEL